MNVSLKPSTMVHNALFNALMVPTTLVTSANNAVSSVASVPPPSCAPCASIATSELQEPVKPSVLLAPMPLAMNALPALNLVLPASGPTPTVQVANQECSFSTTTALLNVQLAPTSPTIIVYLVILAA